MSASLLELLVSWFPMLLLIGVWIYFMTQMKGGKYGAAKYYGDYLAEQRRHNERLEQIIAKMDERIARLEDRNRDR